MRLINDVLEFTDHEKIEAILFSADFEKAFDLLDYSFLFSDLTCFGCGDDFIQWVRTFVNNAELCVMNNGDLTGYLEIGTRQGDHLSAYLYILALNNGDLTGCLEMGTRQGDHLSAYHCILALEVLFIQIRNNREIHAIEIDNVTIKLSAYADDTYFFTLDSHSLQIILKVYENFSEYSTLKLNVEKSKACWIGSAEGGNIKTCRL